MRSLHQDFEYSDPYSNTVRYPYKSRSPLLHEYDALAVKIAVRPWVM
jgi:hypothetical protein